MNIVTFLCTILFFVCPIYAVRSNPPLEPFTPATRANANIFTIRHAVNSANTHFNALPSHLHPSWPWTNDVQHLNAFVEFIRDRNSRFVQIHQHGEYTTYASPWHGVGGAGHYVLLLNTHPLNGPIPIGYAEVRRDSHVWRALQRESGMTQSEMLQRFPHLALL